MSENDPHKVPDDVEHEFQQDLDDHINRMQKHLSQREKQHKEIDKLANTPK
jgi:hypothetical protein